MKRIGLLNWLVLYGFDSFGQEDGVFASIVEQGKETVRV